MRSKGVRMFKKFLQLFLPLILFQLSFSQNIVVTAPNGGEELILGKEFKITWTSPNLYAFVEIQLWQNNRLKAVIVKESDNVQVGYHKYLWKVGKCIGFQAMPGDGYKIRIKLGSLEDISDQFFSIKTQTLSPRKVPVRIPGSVLMDRLQNLPDLWIYYNLPSNFQYNTTFPTVFRIGVKNLGKSGSKACTLKYTITGKKGVLSTIYLPVPAIKAGGKEIIKFQYKFAEGGPHNLMADVDSANIVIESKENNNHLSQSLNVRDDIKPDLVLVDVHWYYTNSIGSTSKVWGKVKNIGKISSPNSKMYIICSPKEKTRTKTIHALPVGAEQEFEFGFEYWTLGTKECGIWVDSDKKIDELREDNNHIRFSFKIISGTIFD